MKEKRSGWTNPPTADEIAKSEQKIKTFPHLPEQLEGCYHAIVTSEEATRLDHFEESKLGTDIAVIHVYIDSESDAQAIENFKAKIKNEARDAKYNGTLSVIEDSAGVVLADTPEIETKYERLDIIYIKQS